LKELDAFASFGHNLLLTDTHLIYTRADIRGVYPSLYALATGSTTALLLPRKTNADLPYSKSVLLAGNLKSIYYIEPSKHSNTLIVWLHGGPYRQVASAHNPYWSYGSYDAVLEAVRKTDVGILKIDYPGSAGHGRLFAESITEKVGVLDSKKTTAAIRNFAERNGYTNIYLVGNSYGGYLALKMLVDTPTLYKGSMSIGGVTDWTTLLTKINNSIFNLQFSGLADEKNYTLHAAASIYNKVSAIGNQKIVLVHGEQDATIPVSQAKEFSTYLSSLNKAHQLILLPGEDHVFKKKASFESLCNALSNLIERTATTTCAFTDE
jgi:dipeptidyl aminopeptidase/acylaminoacyl peptidase